MKKLNWMLGLAGLALPLQVAAAEPTGLAGVALSKADYASLQQIVTPDRLARPAAYDLVAVARGCRPDGWRMARNPRPVCNREFRGLGQAGLLPMLSALALDWQPDVSRLSTDPKLRNDEEQSMLVAMIDTVGMLRDTRARPVLLALWQQAAKNREVQPPVERANTLSRTVAEALGRMGGAVELGALQQHLRMDDPLYTAAIAGLGLCKRTDAVPLLVTALGNAKDEAMQRWVVRSMGTLASSWSWQALGKVREPDGLRVRQRVTDVLLPLLVKTHGAAREQVVEALQLADLPDLAARLTALRAEAVRTSGDATVAHDIDDLLGRVARAHVAR